MFNIKFNCTEEETTKNDLYQQFFHYSSIKNQEEYENNSITIKGHLYNKVFILDDINHIVRIIRRDWFQLQTFLLNNVPINANQAQENRTDINRCLHLILESLKICHDATLRPQYLSSTLKVIDNNLVTLIKTFNALPEEIILKITNFNNKQNCGLYQYFHTYLDLQYNILLIKHLCGDKRVEEHLFKVFNDLIRLAKKNFTSHRRSCFLCDCVRSFWLLVQLFIETTIGPESFWPYFNKTVSNEEPVFVLWLLKDIANLQNINDFCETGNRIKSNIGLMETCLKKALTSFGPTVSILSLLKYVEPLLCRLWIREIKIDIYQILWDYFSRRLNKGDQTKTNLNVKELLEVTNTILWNFTECEEDYEFFLGLLARHFLEHAEQWVRMKGRIYSQLGPNKIRELDETGVFNVLLLFIVLGKVNFEELIKRFVGFIESLPGDYHLTRLVWNCYVLFMTICIRENRSVERLASSFVPLLNQASLKSKYFPLIAQFVTNFDNLIKLSHNLQLQQSLLINTWIQSYLSKCTNPDLIETLTVLQTIIDGSKNELVWTDWEDPFINHIYPVLKSVCSATSAPEIGGSLSANIVLRSPSLLGEAFNFFNNKIILSRVNASFLNTILAEYPNNLLLTPNQQALVIQSWMKNSLSTRDQYEEFTKNLVKLDIVPDSIKICFKTNKDYFNAFIDCLATNNKDTSIVMTKFSDLCFGQIDQWIGQYLNQPENEVIVLRIFTCIAYAFYKIGPLLYNKHKSCCSFTKLVTTMLLPTELVIGKAVHQYILQAMKKTWHLYFEATIKLGSPNDSFIQRTTRELVIKYLPYFSTLDSPILKCLDNERIAGIILEHISNGFLRYPIKEADSNVFKTLKLINEFVRSTTSVQALNNVITKTLYGVFEVIMFHNQRNGALTVIEALASSPLYNQVKEEVGKVIIAITEKHLAFNTNNYFQLMEFLAKYIAGDLKRLIDQIQKHVGNVERMRGVGYDKNLRVHLDKLKARVM